MIRYDGARRALPDGLLGAGSLNVDARGVYWSSTGQINFNEVSYVLRTGLDGGAPVTLASQQGLTGPVLDPSGNVYWYDTAAATINRLAADAGPAVDGGTTPVLASGLGTVAGATPSIATDGVSVYWSAYDNSSPDNNGVFKVSVSGGLVTALAPGRTGNGIVADITGMYWTEDIEVMEVGLDGGTAVTLAKDVAPVGPLAIDGTNVYWTDSGGFVFRVPKGGGAIVTLATAQPGPGAIALSTSSVYWANGSGPQSGIYQLPK